MYLYDICLQISLSFVLGVPNVFLLRVHFPGSCVHVAWLAASKFSNRICHCLLENFLCFFFLLCNTGWFVSLLLWWLTFLHFLNVRMLKKKSVGEAKARNTWAVQLGAVRCSPCHRRTAWLCRKFPIFWEVVQFLLYPSFPPWPPSAPRSPAAMFVRGPEVSRMHAPACWAVLVCSCTWRTKEFFFPI